MKLFQLGLGAPAMIAGFLSSSAVSLPFSSASVITVVHAQTSAASIAIEPKRFTAPPPGPFDQFIEGLTGARPDKYWFVIAGSFVSLDRAKAYAQKINSSHPTFHADVYAPYNDNPNYPVVIGANLTQAQAKVLRDKAVNAGLSKQTYYKLFPELPQSEKK
jgi:hypothetical protein